MTRARPLYVLAGVAALAAVAGLGACNAAAAHKQASGLVSETGRVDASEIAGQPACAGQAADMRVQSLVAERVEAYARYKQALYVAASADGNVLLRETQARAAEAAAQHCESEFQVIVQRLTSAVTLPDTGAETEQLEQLRAEARRSAAVAAAADAQLAAARVAVAAARLDAESAHVGVEAADATVRRLESNLADARRGGVAPK